MTGRRRPGPPTAPSNATTSRRAGARPWSRRWPTWLSAGTGNVSPIRPAHPRVASVSAWSAFVSLGRPPSPTTSMRVDHLAASTASSTWAASVSWSTPLPNGPRCYGKPGAFSWSTSGPPTCPEWTGSASSTGTYRWSSGSPRGRSCRTSSGSSRGSSGRRTVTSSAASTGSHPGGARPTSALTCAGTLRGAGS